MKLISSSLVASVLVVESGANKWQGLRLSRTRGLQIPESAGLRGGIPEKTGREVEPADEEYLGASLWTGSGMQAEFKFMDDLYPTAPMDRVAPDAGQKLQVVPLTGDAMVRQTEYVAPYKVPDPFPQVAGSKCLCELPEVRHPTPEEMEWHKTVAEQLGVPEEQLPKPLHGQGNAKCTCTGDASGEKQWSHIEPVPNSNKFTVEPADGTYSAGNYWDPKIHPSGVIAPMDRLPAKDYPLQARVDRSYLLPAIGREDAVGKSFARYVDQVAAKAEECDTVSKKCTVNCKPGETVTLAMLNTEEPAKILSTHMGNMMLVEYSPMASKKEVSAPCPLAASCTLFRMCRKVPGQVLGAMAKPVPGSECVEQVSKNKFDFDGTMQKWLKCPRGTMACSTVQQMLSASNLKKGDKACRAAAGD